MNQASPNIVEHHLKTRTIAAGLRETVGWLEGDWVGLFAEDVLGNSAPE